ncbi:rhomboid family intramembrane serine protease [Meridianimarinicoccus roseus]|uniref:Rhomboid family intramembrane serine protease n=1 Tax=Meridianimarinicoccus roseus TaxID=2072018 RepID=A0A2V2LIR6_9RHOB|nr:rhomboid family intramembrane serine protease [Meridianimarinicoccus roseus]PWR03901.1 rhomboid family intramembrane serine protease [Meridianimarinicoccus roseus]
MFPIRDHNPAARLPFVNYALIAANVAIFLSYLPLFSNPFALTAFFDIWAIVPAKVSTGQDSYALVSSMFLHGGWMHLLGNMLFLYIFGDNVEDQLGHFGYAAFYLASGIGAGLMQVLAEPGSAVPVVGASGAIAGVMGGYLLLFPRARIDILLFLIVIVRIISVPAWMMLGLWFGMQVVNGAAAQAGTGGVAYWAHAGGFLIGMALLVPAWLRKGGPAYWRRTHGAPAHPEARYRYIRSDVPTVPRTRSAAPSAEPGRKAPGAVPVVRRRR